jgi:hypothetical protein
MNRCCSSSHTGCGWAISTQASSPVAAMARWTFWSMRTVTENRTPARRPATMTVL